MKTTILLLLLFLFFVADLVLRNRYPCLLYTSDAADD